MEIIAKLNKIKEFAKQTHSENKTIGLVPTMGYLHEGHLSLIRQAKQNSDVVIVTRFVNPTQFAPTEDLDAYPTDAKRDHLLSKQAGADIIFEPISADMYLPNHASWVEVPEMAKFLCGKTRPTHFRGVCTVLTKLFNLIMPDIAIFGEKDWQQLTIIRTMVNDLNFPIQILGGALVREEDGLAMSSRNAYLTKEERSMAPSIYKILLQLKEKTLNGETNCKTLCDFFINALTDKIPSAKVDYVSIFDEQTIIPQEKVQDNSRIAVAIYLGNARLLDNLSLK